MLKPRNLNIDISASVLFTKILFVYMREVIKYDIQRNVIFFMFLICGKVPGSKINIVEGYYYYYYLYFRTLFSKNIDNTEWYKG